MGFLKKFFRNVFRSYSEMFVEIIGRAGGAETGHADKHAVSSKPVTPALLDTCLDTDTRRPAKHLILIVAWLFPEEFPARHGDDCCFNAVSGKTVRSLERDRDL